MAIKINNAQLSDVRLRIVPDEGVELKIDHTNNPCVFKSADGRELFACLAPLEISCVGASDTSGPIDIDGKVDVIINGVKVASDLTPEEIIDLFKDSDELEVGIYHV